MTSKLQKITENKILIHCSYIESTPVPNSCIYDGWHFKEELQSIVTLIDTDSITDLG